MGIDNRSMEFVSNIRQYNSAFAFTSVAVKTDHNVTGAGGGPYSFRIQGGLYHRMGTLLPQPEQEPSYAQLYILDPNEAILHRNSRNNTRDPTLMADLDSMLREHNPFVPLYKRAHQILTETPSNQRQEVSACITLQEGTDTRRYNLPTVEEVAAILPGSGEENVQKHREIVC